MTAPTIVVTAKECVPGRVKTRLTPPLTAPEAARVARACLADTLEVAAACAGGRRVLFWDGDAPTGADTDAWEILPQPEGTLDVRLGALFDHVEGPTLLLGMDTPQIDAALLRAPLAAWPVHVDAWFGPSSDGGFWALGLREPRGDLVRGVPMSRPDTGMRQRARLTAAGLRVALLDELTDVDDARSAGAVAAEAPHTRFARAWRAVGEDRR